MNCAGNHYRTPADLGQSSIARPVTFSVHYERPELANFVEKLRWANAMKRDSIDFARIDGGGGDGRTFGIAGTVFLPI